MESRQYKSFWKLINLLHENQLLEHILLVGSWAEYIYAQSGLLPGFTVNLRTLDVDLLIKNLRRPTKPIDFVSIAKEAGHTIDYDILEGTTKFYTSDLLEVEFIIEQKGKGHDSVLGRNMGVSAQALRHLGLLKSQAVEINIFDYVINVPVPEAYVIQKMIINNNRGIKAQKDRQSVANLMPHLNQSKFQEVLGHVSKKEQKIIDEFLTLYGYL